MSTVLTTSGASTRPLRSSTRRRASPSRSFWGSPSDNPETFRRNFERAQRLPCALPVYHCVVLPSGLMVRSPSEHRLDDDPVSLKMISCTGWSETALAAECGFLSRQVSLQGGRAGEFFWTFPPPR